ncbi:MAG: NAD(P)H-hydrate dehydratase [Nitrospina sp.]|nr:NAD(P)H-hydrate dehydratase [Nitrospina sp.]
MKKVATAKQMQKIDTLASSSYGVSGLELMENAGTEIVKALKRRFHDFSSKRVLIFCGKGNNGGDGFVVARQLFNMNIQVTIFLAGRQIDLKKDAAVNAKLAVKLGIDIIELDETRLFSLEHHLENCDMVIDALLGTGLTRPVSGVYKQTIDKINQSKKYVTAIDIPSGLDSDSSMLVGDCIKADLTLVLALFKQSHLLFPAAELMREVELIDIGIPPELVESECLEIQVTEDSDLKTWFPQRSADSHKGDYGHVLVIAGSKGKSGAAGLTALATLRMGCGLVTLALPESCQKAFELHPMEVMTVPAPETDVGTFALSAKSILLNHSIGMSAVAIGPGLSTEPETVQLLRELLPIIDCPLIIDADALNCLAQSLDTISQLKTEAILTPHPKEMSRLMGIETPKILENRIEFASKFARDHSVIIVLKGAATVICQPNGLTTINPTGNPGMATAGSGDVLTGIIASLVAQGFSTPKAAIAGTYLHGLSGDIFAQKESQASLIAGDLLRTLPETMKRILQ